LSAIDIKPTLTLLQQVVEEELELLKIEVLQRNDNFIEGNPLGDGGLMYSIRLTIVIGWLAAYEVIQSRRSAEHTISPSLIAIIDKHSAHLGVWGEYAVPFMAVIFSLEKRIGQVESSEKFLADILRTLVSLNNGKRRSGFPDPYHTPDELLSSFYSLPGDSIDMGQFAGGSYTFRAIVDGLVHLNRRDLLAPMWEFICDTRSIEYYPEDPWDLLLWKSDKGRERDFGYESPTSWAALQAALPDRSEIPEALSSQPDFATYFTLSYPHRFRRDLFCELVLQFSQ
jgi:hypothetical protein